LTYLPVIMEVLVRQKHMQAFTNCRTGVDICFITSRVEWTLMLAITCVGY
jgi:hypothetical protein